MKRLTPVANDPTHLDRYISIRDSKKLTIRKPLADEHAFVTERYTSLKKAVAEDSLSELATDVRADVIHDELRSCYGSPTQALKKLKKEIKDAQPERLLKYCPMCGTTRHSSFDHYLPAVKFPEFAVHPLNLVPCCTTCNSIKDDDWLTADGRRQYLHFYSDDLTNKLFIVVNLHEANVFSGVGATFSLIRPPNVSNQTWALIQSHFDRLHLLDRYNEDSNNEVSEIFADCRIFLNAGGDDVRGFLRAQSVDRQLFHGQSHWRALLMQALADHKNFEDWIFLQRA